MDSVKRLLLANKAWVQEKLSVRPDFFESMAQTQNPEFLWIGCSDSRVPAEDITGTGPGELFVHRNIANLVVHTDFNILSVVQYAVEVLKVKHIIVCGHYNCGGVRHAMSQEDLGLINKWLRQIKDVYRHNKRELEAIGEFQQRYDRLVELNVCEQVQNLAESAQVQRSWRERERPMIHGWVYDLRTGYIKEIASIKPNSKLDEIYMYELNEDEEEAG
jgi:carbonic anhydrase